MNRETNESLKKKCGTEVINKAFGTTKHVPITSKEEYDSVCILDKNGNDAKSILQWSPFDEDRKEFCSDKFWYQNTLPEMLALYPDMDERLYTLKEKLLSFGGEAALIAREEPDIAEILQYGQLWLGGDIEFSKMANNACHSNSAFLWEKNRDNIRICTGYALSDDGMWRQHSWAMILNPLHIVETTSPRIAYFGYVLTTTQCKKFYNSNLRDLFEEGEDDMSNNVHENANTVDWIVHAVMNGQPCVCCGELEYPYLPGFCDMHTHGMDKYSHPEFQVVIDITTEMGCRILNNLGMRVAAGETFKDGDYVSDIIQKYPVFLQKHFDAEKKEVLRVIFPDSEGKFPHDKGCNELFVLQSMPLAALENETGRKC